MSNSEDKDLLDENKALQAVKAVGPGNESPDSPAESFVRACMSFIRGWQKVHAERLRHQQTSPAMFLFPFSALPKDVRSGATRVPAFKNTYPLHLGGNLFVCNENLKEVYQEKNMFVNEDDPLSFVDSEKLQECTAVVLLPAQDAILVHIGGGDANDATRHNLGAVSGEPFTFDQLDHYLTRFYEIYLETHNCHCDVWKFSNRRELKEFVERQIQKNLVAYFELTIGKYGALTDSEINTRHGRSDVRLLKFSDRLNWEQAIMELKVLKPEKTDDENIRWAIQGVGQIEGYRKGCEQKTVASYLCCYDARKVNSELTAVTDAANAASVYPRRYYLKTPGYGLK